MNIRSLLDHSRVVLKFLLFFLIVALLITISLFVAKTLWQIGAWAVSIVGIGLSVYGIWVVLASEMPLLIGEWYEMKIKYLANRYRGMTVDEAESVMTRFHRLFHLECLLIAGSGLAGLKGSLNVIGIIPQEYGNAEYAYRFALVFMVLGVLVDLYRRRLRNKLRGSPPKGARRTMKALRR